MVSFQDHVEYADPVIRPVLRELRDRIIGLGRMQEKPTPAQRMKYSRARDFCEVKIQKNRILVRVFNMEVPDPKGIVTDIPGTHLWQYQKEIPVDCMELVDYAMPFIVASYQSPRARTPRR
jgi:predicted transport protein